MEQKTTLSLILGILISPFTMVVEKYLLSDLHLIINVLVLVIIDTILGVVYAWKRERISSSGFSGIFTKLLVYVVLIIAVNQGHLNQPNAAVRTLMEWLDGFVYSLILIREMLSIFEKAALLGYFRLPMAIKKKLELFVEEGTLDKEENDKKLQGKSDLRESELHDTGDRRTD